MSRLLTTLGLALALGALPAVAQEYTPGGACSTHKWVNAYGPTSGLVCAQPGAGDVSGLAPSATTDTTNASNISSGTLAFARLPALSMYVIAVDGINFNSANTDNAVTINLPSGVSGYQINGIYIANASGSLTTATVGVFTTPGGGGTAVVTGGTAVTVSAAAGSGNSLQSLTINNVNTTEFTNTTLYFRIGTAEGAAATASAVFWVRPMP